MTSESDIEAAAERLIDRGWDYANCPDQWGECNDARVLAQAYLDRLSADRAERDERARPIDAEWLSSIFDEEFDEAFSSRSIMLGVLVPACGRRGWTWVVGDVHVATVTTRGQLLDLLRVLKGGAE